MNVLSKTIHAFFLLFAVSLLQSCGVAPVFSSFENANTLGSGAIEVATSYSSYSLSDEDESYHTNNNFGLKIGYGVKENLDLKIRYERISSDGSKLFDDEGVSFFSFNQKWSVVENKFSIGLKEAIYFTTAYEADVNEYSIGPQFIYSHFFTDQIDVSGGVSYDYFTESEAHGLALQIGMGMMTPDTRWSFRPELSYLKDLDAFSDGTYIHFGFGIGHVFR